MKTGELELRQLDCEVAEKVMEWIWEVDDDGMQHLLSPHATADNFILMPHYSTQIADAWPVHKEMMGRLFSVRSRYYKALQDIVSEPHDFTIAWPDVMAFLEPEHFCLAALKAMTC